MTHDLLEPETLAAAPEAIRIAFGPEHPRCRQMVRALYAALVDSLGKRKLVPAAWRSCFQPPDVWIRDDRLHPFLARFWNVRELPTLDSTRVLFVLHTYYALVVKLTAARAVARRAGQPPDARRQVLRQIESGRWFRMFGVYFLEPDCFAWYLDAWTPALRRAMTVLVGGLEEYSPAATASDLFKPLYQALLPGAVRHVLGEYYTPDWLAERVLRRTLGTANLGDARRRVLDPACGSGTFLVRTIHHVRQRSAEQGLAPAETRRQILDNVVGIDRNPLAVLAARVNYLIALGDLLCADEQEIRIPVLQRDLLFPSSNDADLPAFDFVVGNPPWVNWEHLPADYRRATLPLWRRYGLLVKPTRPLETILGSAKYDLAMLLVLVAADRYLRRGGRLGFVLSRSIFKAAGAGRGFRRFLLPDDVPLSPRIVEDFGDLRVFEGATNRPVIAVFRKGRKMRYPVPYHSWPSGSSGKRPASARRWYAVPVRSDDPTSAWITAPCAMLASLRKILGPSAYTARAGVFTGGANAVFWLTAEAGDGPLVRVENRREGARRPAPRVCMEVERELIYPLLRGADVYRWCAEPSLHVLLTHRRGDRLQAIPEEVLHSTYPQAAAYLKRFARILRSRPAYRRYFRAAAPYYSLFNIGDYTFAPVKVVWREQARDFTAAVVDPVDGQAIVPDHKLMMAPLPSATEAHYLCAALNSTPARRAVAAYAVGIQMDTHILTNIAVPRFVPLNPVHRRLAALSAAAHQAAREGGEIADTEAEVDESAARVWGLSQAELKALQRFGASV